MPAVGRRSNQEDGISLVEMLIAVFILAVVLAAFANTTMTSVASIADNERRSWANQVVNEVIEDFQARSWRELGFYEDDSVADTEGAPVIIGDIRPGTEVGAAGPCPFPEASSPAAAPLHEESFEREDTCFNVTRWIVWDEEHGGDYKRLIVDVDWTVRGKNLDLRATASRAPGPGDNIRFFSASLSASTSTVTYTDNDGDGDPDSASPPSLTFIAEFSAPAKTAPTLHYKSGSNPEQQVTVTPTSSEGGATWTFTHSSLLLPAPQGEAIFIVRGEAIDAPLTTEAETTITFDYASNVSVAVRSLTLDQDNRTPICVKTNDQQPQPNLVIDVDIQGLSQADDGRVGIVWTDGPSDPLAAAHFSANNQGDGAVFRLTVNEDPFPTSPVNFDVYLRDSPSSSTWSLEWTDSNSYTTKTGGDC